MVVVNTSIGRDGYRSRSSFTTVWQRTKSPIHMYGTIRIGGSRLIGDRARIASSESGFVSHLGLNLCSSFAQTLGTRDSETAGRATPGYPGGQGLSRSPRARANGDSAVHCAPVA